MVQLGDSGKLGMGPSGPLSVTFFLAGVILAGVSDPD
jgi:hypothetical protein